MMIPMQAIVLMQAVGQAARSLEDEVSELARILVAEGKNVFSVSRELWRMGFSAAESIAAARMALLEEATGYAQILLGEGASAEDAQRTLSEIGFNAVATKAVKKATAA